MKSVQLEMIDQSIDVIGPGNMLGSRRGNTASPASPVGRNDAITCAGEGVDLRLPTDTGRSRRVQEDYSLAIAFGIDIPRANTGKVCKPSIFHIISHVQFS